MKTRNYGIDFLRMISMIMIVMLHTLGHGGILRSVSFLSVHYQIAWLLEVIAFGAVNTYAMISGFVSVDCSRSKFLSKIFKIIVKNFREIFPVSPTEKGA